MYYQGASRHILPQKTAQNVQEVNRPKYQFKGIQESHILHYEDESSKHNMNGTQGERALYNVPDSDHTNAKSQEISSTIDRHHSNYEEQPYEQSTITARDSDFEANDIQIDEIISINEEQTEVEPQAHYQPHIYHYTEQIRPRRGVRSHTKKNKKNRKIRTTITKEKLAEMNRIFAQYTGQKQQGKNPQFNLKEIGQQLQLGYSTILHKFRQFRATKRVRGGALIASLQKKRKYRKSVQIQQIIQKALTERPFYTAVELSKYILQKFQRSFSRSIISRHLGEMGYSYKNLKSTPIEKNKQKYKEIRRMYAQLMLPLLSDDRTARTVIYVDEMACSLSTFLKRKGTEFKRIQPKEAEEYVSVLIAARSEEVVYYEVREGFPQRRDFIRALGGIRSKMNQLLKYEAGGEQCPLVVVCDLNRIHREGEGQGESIRDALVALNMHQYFLPPFSYQLNPLETLFLNIKNRVSKREIHSLHDLHTQILHYMRELQGQSVEVHFKEVPDWLHKSIRQENF